MGSAGHFSAAVSDHHFAVQRRLDERMSSLIKRRTRDNHQSKSTAKLVTNSLAHKPIDDGRIVASRGPPDLVVHEIGKNGLGNGRH